MIGMKMRATTSMMNSVIWLDDASHTVRLDFGSTEDGRMKGNIASPTVEMMPKMASELESSASTSLRALNKMKATSGKTRPSAGASIIHGCAA
ncbi:hypothetical protein D3C72_1189640 [compost metagenome]